MLINFLFFFSPNLFGLENLSMFAASHGYFIAAENRLDYRALIRRSPFQVARFQGLAISLNFRCTNVSNSMAEKCNKNFPGRISPFQAAPIAP